MLVYPKGQTHKQPIEKRIAEHILGALVIGTTLAVGPVAGVVGFFVAVGAGHLMFRKSAFNREVKRLKKNGYVALTKTDKGWIVKLLEKGRRRYTEIEMANLRLSKPVHQWDGKWRVFIFDIPEEIRSKRDSLREKLKSLGLYNIQKSVFIYPYDCRKELDFVAGYYDLGKYTTYGELSYTDIGRELKKHFKSLKILP